MQYENLSKIQNICEALDSFETYVLNKFLSHLDAYKLEYLNYTQHIITYKSIDFKFFKTII